MLGSDAKRRVSKHGVSIEPSFIGVLKMPNQNTNCNRDTPLTADGSSRRSRHDAVVVEPGDLAVGIADFAQNLVGVFA